jgi:hypothetical protein
MPPGGSATTGNPVSTPAIWAVGNENHIPGVTAETPYYVAKAYMAPADYAAACDAFADALLQQGPGVEVGFIASRGFRNWNLGALTRISEPADFISVHLLDPSSCDLTTSDQVVRLCISFLQSWSCVARERASAACG